MQIPQAATEAYATSAIQKIGCPFCCYCNRDHQNDITTYIRRRILAQNSKPVVYILQFWSTSSLTRHSMRCLQSKACIILQDPVSYVWSSLCSKSALHAKPCSNSGLLNGIRLKVPEVPNLLAHNSKPRFLCPEYSRLASFSLLDSATMEALGGCVWPCHII